MMNYLIDDRRLTGTAGSANQGTPVACNQSAYLI